MTETRLADRTCLATVTDDKYLPGTVVLFSSVLRHNPGFRGDLVVIHSDLGDEARERLAHFPRVRFHPVSEALKERVAALARDLPAIASRAARLYSLDAFALPYDTILFADSDVLCVGDLRPILDQPGGLLAGPDLSYRQGMVRDARTFSAVDPARWPSGADIIAQSFNAGVLVIRPSQLPPSTRADLLAAVTAGSWDGVLTGHTDQLILNRYFRGAWQRFPDAFNVLLPEEPGAMVSPPADDAVFLHFLGRGKPWEVEDDDARDRPRNTARARAVELWRDAWAVLNREEPPASSAAAQVTR